MAVDLQPNPIPPHVAAADPHIQYLLASGARALAGHMSFAGYKAIAMACDNGATVPASPSEGQWYLHTPTGRNVLLLYKGAAWNSIISFGTFTVYVDKTDGTDAIDNGGAADASAVKTVQYAVNLIPGLVGGNVTININAETYAETVTIQGKNLTGAYTITLQGMLTSSASATADSKVQGATTTQGTITDAGAFGSFDNKLIHITATGEYHVIDSDTANIITIVDYFNDGTNLAYSVFDWGTVIQSVVIIGQSSVVINDIALTSGGSYAPLNLSNFADASVNRCSLTAAWHAMIVNQSRLSITDCYALSTLDFGAAIENFNASYVLVETCKLANNANSGRVVLCHEGANIGFSGVNVLDGLAGANKAEFGLYVYTGGAANMGYGYGRIRNCDTGIAAVIQGGVFGTVNYVYTNNGANETATAASYGYID